MDPAQGPWANTSYLMTSQGSRSRALDLPEKCFDVTGIQLKGPGAICYALFRLFLLGGHGGAVEEDLGIGALVVRVDIQRLARKARR